MRILLVEDQDGQARNVGRRPANCGFVIDRVGKVHDALFAGRYALAVSNRKPPDGDGLQIIPELRQAQPESRV